MKKVGIVLIGIGFGIVLYLLFTLLFHPRETVSPIEGIDTNKVIQQNIKK